MNYLLPRHTRQLTLTLATFAFVVALAGAGASPVRRARAQEEEPAPPGEKEERTCDVYGRALYAETGRPVRRSRVTLLSTGGNRTDLGALTNARGEFRIKNVRAGSYFISVDSPGMMSPVAFLSFDELQSNSFESAFASGGVRKFFEAIEVNGKDDKEVTVRAHRGAAIGGKVTYADGDPVPGAQVNVLRRRDGHNSRLGGGPQAQLSVATTDERGRFRVAALPPGDYVVAVSELVTHGEDYSGDRATASPLLLTYHPSETKADKATIVTVDAGEEREGVDVTLAERETHAISGTVRGKRDGRPILGATVSFTSTDSEAAGLDNPYAGYGPNSVTTDEQGRFRFEEMPDGEYTIKVAPPSADEEAMIDSEGLEEDGEVKPAPTPAPTPPKKYFAPARRTINVAGNDLTDVVFALGDASRITGRIVAEGGAQLPENKYVTVMKGEGQDEHPDYYVANINGDEFTIEGVPPGKYTVYTNFYPVTEKSDFYIKSVNWRGHDLMRERLEIKEGESAEGLSVVFTKGCAEMRLRLYAAADKTPARGVNVILAPVDSSQRFRTDLPFCTTDREGACAVSGAPGDYALLTFKQPQYPNIYNEREAERLIAAAPRVTLRPGKPASFELVLSNGH